MHILALCILFMSVDPSRPSRIKEERIAVSYQNPVTNEEAQMVRQQIYNFYVYRIKIGARFISEAYDDITTFRWSDDGRHFFFIAVEKNGQKRVVQDGRPHLYIFDLISQIQFSHNHHQLAYLGFLANPDPEKSRVVVVLNGLKISDFKEVTNLYFDEKDDLVYQGKNFDD